AFAEPLAVQLDLAPRHVHPGMTPGARFVGGALALVEEREVERRVLVDGDRPVPAVPRGDEAQLSPPVGGGARLLLVGGLDASLRGDAPGSAEVDGSCR